MPLGANPVFQGHPDARLMVVGQAPGTAVHKTGIPFNDPSGDRLRDWLGMDRDQFYDPQQVALVPMGFCYPGKGQGGDLPPRPECAATWRKRLLSHLQSVQTTVMVGRYAIDWHLQPERNATLAALVANWQQHAPEIFLLPHPSPRNGRWLRERPWVEAQIVPVLRARVASIFSEPLPQAGHPS
ncbi:MAG: uracil-DNA glycosylase family protein [Pseudomonadota bacterium]